ncbi:unnamed protein product [Allacma fusca]|uniref:Carbohydrate sulfotransferase n=1 Tax=Allacma fusca TaxID=39272 RepID=A0A8J2L3E3_9HEXA|nr:unnamed protein product [Allacma fusca]
MFTPIRRFDIKSLLWILFVLLLIFTLLAFFTTHSPRWFIPGFSRTNPETTRMFSLCEQFPRHERINWNYLYYYKDRSSRKSLIWCKVPKAGSTTLTRMFLRLAGARKFNSSDKIHRMLRDFYPKLADKLMQRRMKTTFKFLVVRDPFERILSAYRDKLEDYARDLQFRDGYYYETYGKSMVGTPVDNSTVREPTWTEFVNYLIQTPMKKYDEHWMPITRLCSPCNIHFDAIVRMEKFDEGIKQPLQEVGIDFQIGWAHKTGTSHKDVVDSYFRNLTSSQVHRLYQKYKKDFILFGYSPHKYFYLANSTSGNYSNISTPTVSTG